MARRQHLNFVFTLACVAALLFGPVVPVEAQTSATPVPATPVPAAPVPAAPVTPAPGTSSAPAVSVTPLAPMTAAPSPSNQVPANPVIANPGTVTPTPVTPGSAAPAEAPKAGTESKGPAVAAPAAPADDMNKPSADASNAVELKLVAKPVLILRGQANWDEGYEALMKAFKTLRTEAGRLGVAHVGKPQAMFSDTNDQTFKYEAMLTLEKEPDAGVKPQGGMSFGKSPEGRAFVFKHVGAYDDIDSVYEAITAWLDEKNLTAKGAFVEEYLNEPQGADDALLELNIYVFVQ